MEAGVYQPATETLGSVLSEYLVKVTPAKKSAASEKRRINRLMRDPISHYRVCDLTPEVLAAFRDKRLEQGLRASGYDLQIIRHALNVAMSEWGLTLVTNPVNKIRMPKKPKGRERRLKPGEYELLLKHARLSKSWFLEPLIILGVETGMRLGEMLKLRWEDWDPEKQTLYLRDTKNGLDRFIPINGEAKIIVCLLNRSDKQLFPTNYEAVKSAWVRLRIRANIPDLRFHDLRHEAISRWFDMGLSIPEVMRLSGHATHLTALSYSHVNCDSLQQKITGNKK
jgi:integrase